MFFSGKTDAPTGMAPERRVTAASLLEKVRRNAVGVKFCFIATARQSGGWTGGRLGAAA